MILRPYWIIFALAVYLPFENLLLKWLPVSDRIYSFARLGSEVLIYIVLVLVVFNRLWKRLPLRRTSIDMLLVLFILIAIASIIVNNGNIFRGIVTVRTLLRYVAVYYIVVNSKIGAAQVRKLIFLIIFIALVESLIGCIQFLIGTSQFWLPRATIEVAGFERDFTILQTGVEKGAVIGTFGHTVSMSLYLLFAECLLLSIILAPSRVSRLNQIALSVLFIIILVAILFTYSRGAFFAVIVAIPLTLILCKRKKLLLKSIVFVIFFSFLYLFLSVSGFIGANYSDMKYANLKKEYVNPIYNLKMLFSSDYLESIKGRRQWIVTEVGKAILMSATLIGFSPDEEVARNKIAEISGGMLQRVIYSKAFEDVYWIAMFAYYGIIGLGVFIGILFRLYRCSRWIHRFSVDQIFCCIGASMTTLILIMIPISFIVRGALINRVFSFYFWMLAGIMTSEYRRAIAVNSSIKFCK